MEKTNVVIIGRNPNSLLEIICAAGESGCNVSVVKTVKKMPGKISYEYLAPQSKSKYLKDYAFSKEPDAKGLIDLLKTRFITKDGKTVLLPTDDYAAETIDTYQDELREHFFMPNIKGEAGAVVRLMDKNCQKILAKNVGLPVAKGWSIQLCNGRYEIPEDIVYPCFVKPETAILNRKRYMAKCDNVEELTHVLNRAAQQQDCLMLVEEYKEIKKESCIVGFSNGQDVVAPALIETIQFGSGSHKGVTAVGKVSPRSQNKDLFEKIEKFIGALGFIGLFDIDLYECHGTVYFNELNVRQGASGYAITRAGVNLPAMLINTLVNPKYSPPNTIPIVKELTFANDFVSLDDYGAGFISRKELKKRLSTVDIRFLVADKDRRPQRYFTISIIRQWGKRLLKHFK